MPGNRTVSSSGRRNRGGKRDRASSEGVGSRPPEKSTVIAKTQHDVKANFEEDGNPKGVL